MGHEELARHLIRAAEAKREEILSRARDEAGRIAGEASRLAEAVERKSREEAERQAERERRARRAQAREEAKAMRLRARAAVADAVLERLSDRLSGLVGEDRYPLVAEKLYREILPEIPPGNVVLRADERAREALRSQVSDPRVRFEPLPGEEIGGVEASDESGAFLLRNTLRSRFRKARPLLLSEAWRRLPFPDE